MSPRPTPVCLLATVAIALPLLGLGGAAAAGSACVAREEPGIAPSPCDLLPSKEASACSTRAADRCLLGARAQLGCPEDWDRFFGLPFGILKLRPEYFFCFGWLEEAPPTL